MYLLKHWYSYKFPYSLKNNDNTCNKRGFKRVAERYMDFNSFIKLHFIKFPFIKFPFIKCSFLRMLSFLYPHKNKIFEYL